MFPLISRHRSLATVLANLAIATFAYVLAFALRFDLEIPAHFVPVLVITLPLLLACKLAGFWYFGIFSGSWRFLALRDVEDIVRGNLLAWSLFIAGMVFLHEPGHFPRSVFLLDLLLCILLMVGIRLGIQVVLERSRRPRTRRIETLAVVVGAGSAGIHLLQEIESRPRLKIAVVGFVDDDPSKIGVRFCGVPVLGKIDELPAIVVENGVNEALIAIPSATGSLMKRIVQRCTEAGVRHRVLPTIGELVEGRVMYTQMREVKVDDLLAREPVQLDLDRVRSLIAQRTVLVTGAAGSIGSELCRQLAAREPGRIVLYDRHENGIYALEMELHARFPGVKLEPILGDVLLEDQLASVFAEHRPELVFHAAAYKHVPIAERNVLEALRNNVLGTRNVARAALARGVKELVLVSTDKAVRPTSVMGVTKRIAEMVVQGMDGKGCRFVAVRFGNVLGSNGSVVPMFREQIARGGPVTVTDPEVTRYFMTIPEAAQLILQAATLGNGGEIFILEMGQPVRIVDLARHMIRLSGFEPDEDIAIAFTGLRPGEKMHEELVAAEEEVSSSRHDRIKVLLANKPLAPAELWIARIEECVEAADLPMAVRLLKELVPAYKPSNSLIEASSNGVGRKGKTAPALTRYLPPIASAPSIQKATRTTPATGIET